ncbi:YaiO family outer membrane beta-barrel protein [Spirosoma taeanense]|uniref:YaiO family outer membrane beta-barrel protein n=1 Tax=Spirosoma taeanense TaxID=2735870 RepID=A0A6M5YB62_9BACT|nr:YaiO family outer membrane beta-barrel protein [Spirosoma taeanense]QJW91209.1 YaiO family outer membrane beta-barrel protein [Spirosoma taeanense]
MKTRSFVFVTCLLLRLFASAQSGPGSDDLFKQARQAAFDNKDYARAIALCQQALKQSPDYAEIRTFMGRLYTWSDKLPEARQQFSLVLQKDSTNKDALSAATDLEFWNDNPSQALVYCNTALRHYPADPDLLLKKARVLNDLKQTSEAYTVAAQLLRSNPDNADARALADRLKWAASRNMISVGYDYLYFDRNYNDALHKNPWSLANISYGRSTRLGTVTGRLNYAKRFGSTGFQGELDAYPHINNTFYSYLNVGFSGSEPVFPRFRAGASLYANLPKSFEAEVGFRYLKFTDETWIYTVSASKYIKSFWLNLRTYLVPNNSDLSQTYIGTVRYYYGTADDFIALAGGTGISPDEARNVLLGQDVRKLASQRASIEFRKSFGGFIPSVVASWFAEDQTNRPRGNQWGISFSLRQRF